MFDSKGNAKTILDEETRMIRQGSIADVYREISNLYSNISDLDE